MALLDTRQITFGGVVVPAYVCSAPKIIKPVRKMTVVQIAGSNREVVEMEDAWETYDQTYSLFVGDGSEDCTEEKMMDVASVLYKSGWQTLVDDYDEDHYRLAYYKGGLSAENRYTRLAKFDVTFTCRPERFLNSGSTAVSIPSGEAITNPTSYDAKPLIKITGSGSGNLVVGETTMAFTGIVDYLYIDCDRMDVYRLPSENRNSLMTGDFPVLKPSTNIIAFTGGITSCEITPKWWEL